VSFPPGEVMETVPVPVLSNSLVAPIQWTLNLGLSNPTAPATIVNSNATLTILNDNSFVAFGSANYTVPKDILTGLATLNVTRFGATAAACSVNLVTTTNGTAVPGVDFNPTNITINFAAGQTNATVPVQILNNANIGPNLTVVFQLTNAVSTLLTAPSNTTLTIINTSTGPGQLYFASTNYTVNESGLQAVVTVLRTNGFGGPVSADYTTVPGTALPGVNYQTVSGAITLNDGVSSGTITIPLLENNPPQTPVSFSVALSNPSTGASLIAPTNTIVTINDDINTGVAFLSATNYFEETNGTVSVFVQRLGNITNSFSIQYATTNGTALAGVNYVSNSGTLNFPAGETQAGISMTLMNHQDVTNLAFGISLYPPAASSGVSLLSPSNSVVVETPSAVGLSFTAPTNSVYKNGGSITVPVVCLNPSLEPVIVNSNTVPLSVNFQTVNGSALAGIDYVATNGTLIFTNGIITNTITVPIINNSQISALKTFSVTLSQPEPLPLAQVVAPTNEAITIIDSNSGLSFSTPNYSIGSGGLVPITIVRTDNTNTTSQVSYATTGGGSAVANTDYYPTNGTLIFAPGQTSATFNVLVIGSSSVQPNKTVLLALYNPTNGVLVAPSAATLTIYNQNGSFIVPAGVSLASTVGAPGGILQSNQTATLYFGFRDAGGINVSSLYATLLSSANVVPVGTTTKNYGPLTVNGPSASQAFMLTPLGTNGQTIQANFQLEAISVGNKTNWETNAFSLTVGSWSTTFSNTNIIIITPEPPSSSGPQIASPYPSIITVSNVGGVLVGSTVTLTNFSETSPQAVDVLVVSPEQADTLLMAHVGSQNVGVKNVTLTFSNAVPPVYLPISTSTQPLTNGVYNPSQDGPYLNFP
jgi:Calx-beta domain